jgi:outer membrane protein insertion porin family
MTSLSPYSLAILLVLALPAMAAAQLGGGGMGGMGGGMGGGPGGGGGAPPGIEKPKFRDHIHQRGGLPLRREKGDAIVLSVRVTGNRVVESHRLSEILQTRKDRFYDYETVLGDVRRLNDMGAFEHVSFQVDEQPDGFHVTFIVRERPVISKVVLHGNRRLNNRELKGRAGLSPADPLSEFSVESARRRLIDYYHEEGFNHVAISSGIGLDGDPGVVYFRINEGPKERIAEIQIEGATVVSEARLKKIIKSRGPMAGVLTYVGNTADLKQIDADVKKLESYYQDLGFLTATAGRRIEYDESGTWLTVTFVINEGRQFKINGVQIVGNQFITEESIRERLDLDPGDLFNGTRMRRDVGEIVYGYGELGFIYAEVEPQIVMRDELDSVDLVYKITEGDRWKIGQIFVNIDGEPHLMRETTMLNLIEQREGDWIDRRKLELDRVRLERSQLLETNPSIADPPDITVVPVDERWK